MEKTKKTRAIPVPTRTTEEFWEGIRAGKLLLQYDPDEMSWQFYPRAGSLMTGKRNIEWREATGRGTVYSFTETYVPIAGFEDRVPYFIAMVDLEEGVRILANLINVEAKEVTVGMPVKVAFEEITKDANYFCFEPA